MKVVLFGATGMIGSGVLRECLRDPEVTEVLSIGRRATGHDTPKLREIALADFGDYSMVESQFAGYDACFFCLGISSVGMTPEDYRRITVDYTVAAARALLKHNPNLTFVFVSGAGTNSAGTSRRAWANVKGEAENALLAMPFKAAYMLRPGYIQPVHGIPSKTALYRWAYAVMAPLYPLWKLLFPSLVTTTEHLGRAMLLLARQGYPKKILESADIERLGSQPVLSAATP